MSFARLNQRFSDWALRQTIAALDRLGRDDEGQDLMEYVLIGGVIVVLIVGAVWRYGGRLLQLWNRMIQGMR